jgi:hypothetical protein
MSLQYIACSKPIIGQYKRKKAPSFARSYDILHPCNVVITPHTFRLSE